MKERLARIIGFLMILIIGLYAFALFFPLYVHVVGMISFLFSAMALVCAVGIAVLSLMRKEV